MTRAVRQDQGHNPEPSTVILDSQSAKSGPQAGERGVDGKKMVKGIKRHVLTCSLGFVLAVMVAAANVHHTAAAGPLLDKAADAGWLPKRVNADAIYTSERMEAAVKPYGLDVQISSRPADVAGFAPLPLRRRIGRTFGTHTNGYRRLTRNLEQDASAAENAVEIVHFHRVLIRSTKGEDESRTPRICSGDSATPCSVGTVRPSGAAQAASG
jgi:putative transposase